MNIPHFIFLLGASGILLTGCMASQPRASGTHVEQVEPKVQPQEEPLPIAPEPGSELAQPPERTPRCLVQVGGGGPCYDSVDEACAAIPCPRDQCSFLYGHANTQVGCELRE